jgi:nucleoid DNA-binding protein
MDMAKAAAKAPKKAMTKSGLLQHLVDGTGLKKTDVSKAYDLLVDAVGKELKKSGVFTLPGIARLKLKRVAAYKGGEKKVMPATGLEYTTKPKAAHNKVKAFPVKALKDALA